MQTNSTGGPHDRQQPWKATAEPSHRPACAMGKDIIAQILVKHWARPTVEDGQPVGVDCMGEGCGFRSSPVELVGDDAIWAEHAYHVADLLEQAGVGEAVELARTERLRLADKLDEEVSDRESRVHFRWNADTNLGWTQAANHLRHPTATA